MLNKGQLRCSLYLLATSYYFIYWCSWDVTELLPVSCLVSVRICSALSLVVASNVIVQYSYGEV